MLFTITNESGALVDISNWTDFELTPYIDPAREFSRTVTFNDTAGGTFSDTVMVIVCNYTLLLPKQVTRVAKSSRVITYHNGRDIPTSYPKDPNSDIWLGFEMLGFEDDEWIQAHSILIDGVVVAKGETVNGLTYVDSKTNGLNIVGVRVKDGNEGNTSRVTLRYTTQYIPSDDRSQDFEIKTL